MFLRPISDLQQKIKNSYYFMSGDLLLSSSTLGEVLDHSADQAGDSTAIISSFQGISKNYSQFRNEVNKYMFSNSISYNIYGTCFRLFVMRFFSRCILIIF